MEVAFTVKNYDGVNYTDKSLSLKEYDTPATSLELAAAGFLYIGFEKSFNSFFVELAAANANTSIFTAEYYNGVSWTALKISDETNGFKNSGFICFEKPEDMALVTVDALEKVYIRLITDVDTSGVSAKLLDILFSSDLDLIKVKSNIVSKFAPNGTWAEKHIAAREHIIQAVRNKGNVKVIKVDNGVLPEEIYYKDVTKFDFLEPMQLRAASKYLALYFIFWYELSDEENDKWQIKAKEMYRLYEEAVNSYFLALDYNDDGKQDQNEYSNSDSIRTISINAG